MFVARSDGVMIGMVKKLSSPSELRSFAGAHSEEAGEVELSYVILFDRILRK